MSGVSAGFIVIGVVLLTGYLAARHGLLGDAAEQVLSRLSFTIGLPALMFTQVSSTPLSRLFSPAGLIAISTAVVVMGRVAAIGMIRRWGTSRIVIGALSAGLVNSTNLGVPLSMYVFGSAEYVTTIMLFQLALVTPIALTVLDLTLPRRQQTGWWHYPALPFKNPVTVAALLGLAVNLAGLQLPTLVTEPFALLAQLTVPVMLLLFGMSFHGARPGAHRSDRAPVVLASVLKSLVQPALAWAAAAWVFRLDAAGEYVAVVCAALPTGQNVVVYAMRYRAGLTAARTTAIITTIATIPVVVIAVLVLHA